MKITDWSNYYTYYPHYTLKSKILIQSNENQANIIGDEDDVHKYLNLNYLLTLDLGILKGISSIGKAGSRALHQRINH